MSTVQHSAMFDDLKLRYSYKYVRIDQLQQFVSLKQITEIEYKEITGEDYPVQV